MMTSRILSKKSMFVSHVEGPSIFWGLFTNSEEVELTSTLETHLQAALPGVDSLKGEPDPTKIYGAIFTADGVWYRCRVQKFLEPGKVDVQFIDYGNRELKFWTDLVELPNELALITPRAKRLYLDNIKPNPEKSFAQGQQYLKGLIEGMEVDVQIVASPPNFTAAIVYSKDGTNINELLIHKGYATQRSSAPRSGTETNNRPPKDGPRQKIGEQGVSRPVWTRVQDQAGLEDQGTPQGRPQDHARPQDQGRQQGQPKLPDHARSQQPNNNRTNSDSASPRVETRNQVQGGQKVGGQTWSSSSEYNDSKRQEKNSTGSVQGSLNSGGPASKQESKPWQIVDQRLMGRIPSGSNGFTESEDNRSDKVMMSVRPNLPGNQFSKTTPDVKLEGGWGDNNKKQAEQVEEQLRAELNRQKDINKHLNNQLTNAKFYEERCQELENVVKAQKAESLDSRISRLLTELGTSHKYRRLIPADNDVIEIVLNILNDTAKVTSDMEEIIKVKNVSERYQDLQTQIRDCRDKDSRPALVGARDNLRRQFCGEIRHLCEHLATLPLDSRLSTLCLCIHQLKDTYGGIRDEHLESTETLEQSGSMYKTWKNRKLGEFSLYRKETNKWNNEFQAVLDVVLQHCRNLDGTAIVAGKGTDLNTDHVLKQLATALDKEIKKAEVTFKEEGVFLSTIVHVLLNVTAEEVITIEEIRKFQKEQEEIKIELEPWLDRTPDLQTLVQAKDEVSRYRTQLRYGLFELDNLIMEQSSPDPDALNKKKNEVNETREKLQNAFRLLDRAEHDLYDLAMNHFPELVGSGLSAELLQYKGLVRCGRKVEFFNITSEVNQVRFSTFCGNHIALKELVIPSDRTKEEMLDQLMVYWLSGCQNLCNIQSVFYTESRLFIQMQRYECNLYELKVKQTITEQIVLDMLRSICTALNHLSHHGHVVHARVHPANIFWHNDHAVLAEIECTKPPGNRVQPFHQVPNFRFLAPETMRSISSGVDGHVVTHLSDVYCLGLVAVWLLGGTLGPSGTIEGIGKIRQEVKDLLATMLQVVPTDRLTALDVLRRLRDIPASVDEPDVEEETQQLEEQGVAPGSNLPLGPVSVQVEPPPDYQDGQTDELPSGCTGSLPVPKIKVQPPTPQSSPQSTVGKLLQSLMACQGAATGAKSLQEAVQSARQEDRNSESVGQSSKVLEQTAAETGQSAEELDCDPEKVDQCVEMVDGAMETGASSHMDKKEEELCVLKVKVPHVSDLVEPGQFENKEAKVPVRSRALVELDDDDDE